MHDEFAVCDSVRVILSVMPARHGITGQVRPKRRSAPYSFILEALAALEPEVRPMFSGFAVYVGE
jgi:hypothetical protein